MLCAVRRLFRRATADRSRRRSQRLISSAPMGRCYAEGRTLIGNRGEFSLAEVQIQAGETLENALRRFKRKVLQEDIIKEIKRHAFYLKPGQKKRVKSALARKRARKKRPRDGEPDRRTGPGTGRLPATLPGPVHHRGVAGA